MSFEQSLNELIENRPIKEVRNENGEIVSVPDISPQDYATLREILTNKRASIVADPNETDVGKAPKLADIDDQLSKIPS